ncbi:3-dehydroquinate synthase family protein [Sulfurimonas sp.]|uniref:3-dehydroquinate synthase family protein n=1 Tax=Sulfurimonas sp. TaxID=2022749 RepID=UPI003D148652
MNRLDIFSDKDTYELVLDVETNVVNDLLKDTKAIVIDKNVLELYKNQYCFEDEKLILIDALEWKKTPEEALRICEEIMLKGVKRKDKIVAIGGGITQDLVTFATSVLYRGIKWVWLPTTLLAQADSCIGGKSSLNYKSWKNIIGNFYPPEKIIVQSDFLNTLSDKDIRSGIGEILKVHLLSGVAATESIVEQLKTYKDDQSIMSEMILNSLKLKNKILEIDPLDQGLRLKMNYGHSFGHALEAATNFAIPHGIAVTIGLDIANYIAFKYNHLTEAEFLKLHSLISDNLEQDDFVVFEFKDFLEALQKDKKNDAQNYNLIIPVAYGEVALTPFKMDQNTESLFHEYFEHFYQ